MDFFRKLAYDYSLGGFPVMVLVGFATYALFLLAAMVAGLRRWIRPMRRVSVRLHRWLAFAGLVLAAVHLVMGLSVYL